MLYCDIILTPGGEDDEIFTAKIVFSNESLPICVK